MEIMDELTFETLMDMLSEADNVNLETMLMSSMDKPWLVQTIAYSLSDQNPGLSINPRETIKSLFDLMINFHSSSISACFDLCTEGFDLDKMLKCTQQDRYFIEAANGCRIATAIEVAEGTFKVLGDQVIELKNDPEVKLSDSEYTFINLFNWTVTGYWKYYIKAGYKCEYIGQKLKEPEIRYIARMTNVLNRMCELLRDPDYFNNIILKLKRIKRLGAYKYPNYEEDEVQCDEEIVFIVDQLTRCMPKNKTKTQYACSRILKMRSGKYANTLSTEEKITLRKGYYELKHPDVDTNTPSEEDLKNTEVVRDLCTAIKRGVMENKISDTDFAVRVVSTICKSNYRYCSNKQMNVLLVAANKIKDYDSKGEQLAEIQKKAKENNIDVNTEAGFSLSSMSNLLGKGLMQNE